MQLDQVLETFLCECRELLESMESALLAIAPPAVDPEQINAIFRAAHTIKGSAGLFGLDHVVAFTHVVESVLDRVRAAELSIDEDLRGLLLASGDHIAALIAAIAAGERTESPALGRAGEPLLVRLRHYLAPVEAARAETETIEQAVARREGAVTGSRAGGALATTPCWHLSLRFGGDELRNGMDPLSFLRYLATLGELRGVVTLADALPPAEEMDAETCYLGFELAFAGDVDRATLDSVFEFVRDEASIRMLPPHSPLADYRALIAERPEGAERLGAALVRCGSLTPDECAALSALADDPACPAVQAAHAGAESAAPRADAGSAPRPVESATIRVDADKLDHLINRVGELIIAVASTNLVARRAGLTELQDCTSTLSTLVEEVRDSALQLRMVRIGSSFRRFQRVVHDVALELGKDIRLVILGEETELDKTVVERIADPLTHLVRNAMDHGIGDPATRTAAGKPAHGTITLNAYHDSGSVVIEVADDGRGLNRDRIRAKAVERGLIDADRVLGDDEIFALIFEPGFSTAEQVTNLSGRGVGMDVVKRSITALRGTIEIDSAEGVGTTVRIRLPLTLAIIDGFLIGLGDSTFVVPLDMIEECLDGAATAAQGYTELRGQVLPLIRLRELFDIEGAQATRPSVVVVRHGGRKAGLVVDALHGEFQTVIKPLGKMFRQVRCISGSTILGSGEVGLILDVPALMQQAAREQGNGIRPAARTATSIPAPQ